MARCDENARKGTGYGVCDTKLDGYGQCPNAGHHVPTDEIHHVPTDEISRRVSTRPDPAARLVERVRQVRRLIQDAEAEVWDRPVTKTRERRQFIAQQRAALQALEECAEIFGVQLPAWDAVALNGERS